VIEIKQALLSLIASSQFAEDPYNHLSTFYELETTPNAN